MAHETARILIEYNEEVCWIDSNGQASSGSLPLSSRTILGQEISSPKPRQPVDKGRLHALAAAAEISRPTTQQGSNSNVSDASDIPRTGRMVVEGQTDGTADDAYDTSAHAPPNIIITSTENSSSAVGDACNVTRSPRQRMEGFNETENQLDRIMDYNRLSQSFSDFLNNDKYSDFDLNDGSKLDLDKTLSGWDWWSQLPQD